MVELNQHDFFATLLEAWLATGNDVYPQYFDGLVKDWVLHLPCNNAVSSIGPGTCVPLGRNGTGAPVCRWDDNTLGGKCATGTYVTPWESLRMGTRMQLAWPQAFFGFQKAKNFSVDARALMLLGVSEHMQALVVDGGHPGTGTINWEIAQWKGLLNAALAWPEIMGSAAAADTAMHYLTTLITSGVYPDGVESEMAAGCKYFFCVLHVRWFTHLHG